jgi:hypothetical protein
MRIDAQKLAAQGLKLNLDRDGLRRRVELAPSHGVTGHYASDDEHIRIVARATPFLHASKLAWQLESLMVELVASAELEEVTIDLDIPRDERRTSGTLLAERVRLDGLSLQLASSEHPIKLEGIEIQSLAIELGDSGTRVRAARVSIESMSLTVGEMELRAEGLAIGQLDVAGGDVAASAAVVSRLKLHHPNVRAWWGPDDDGAQKKDEKREPLDLSLLDGLGGRLDVDLTADTTLPLIGQRKATHHFRIPISEGTIDFKGVEHNLSALEDSVLDFVVKGGELRLVRDIPLLPWDAKTLVYWPLDADELELASRQRVRLRRLMSYQLPASDAPAKKSDEKSGVQIRAVHMDNLVLEVSLSGPSQLAVAGGRLRLGSADRPAIGSLSLQGNVHYDAKGEPALTSLELEAKHWVLALVGLAIGERRLDADEVLLAKLSDTSLAFRGLSPGELQATLSELALRGVRLTPR